MNTDDGLVVVDKPAGRTSHDVVAAVRRLAGTRRVGHAGTLDPMATGVLVIGLNRATRLLGHLALTEKAYDAKICLGASTVTDDAEGEVTASSDASRVQDSQIGRAVTALTGDILQVPSAVSAVKIDGQRAYKRVRAGEDVAIPARPVTVSRFEVVGTARTGTTVELDVRVECSSGTYVRALARDLGSALGVGGHLTALRRTRVGPYTVEQARTLERLADELVVLPIADAARAAFAGREVDADDAVVVSHGGPIRAAGLPGPVAVFGPDGTFLALLEDAGERTKTIAVFV
ncbi:MAG: tRNA pseudouridine55 synthase [Actinomycetota bacterium]|jgi:tRNA pseudouridine55 synthase|nr:tRNA pseudouridine55 synthase [Actinomycetota bacterium]